MQVPIPSTFTAVIWQRGAAFARQPKKKARLEIIGKLGEGAWSALAGRSA
jgi:hypothetical protein